MEERPTLKGADLSTLITQQLALGFASISYVRNECETEQSPGRRTEGSWQGNPSCFAAWLEIKHRASSFSHWSYSSFHHSHPGRSASQRQWLLLLPWIRNSWVSCLVFSCRAEQMRPPCLWPQRVINMCRVDTWSLRRNRNATQYKSRFCSTWFDNVKGRINLGA